MDNIKDAILLNLINRVLALFEDMKPEDWPLPGEKAMRMFVEYLYMLKCKDNEETADEEVFEFFEEYSKTDHYGLLPFEDLNKRFGNYPIILFWHITVQLSRFGRFERGELTDLESAIVEITKRIILKGGQESLLAKESIDTIKEVTRNFTYNTFYRTLPGNESSPIPIYRWDDQDEYDRVREVIDFFNPHDFRFDESWEADGTNGLFPKSLYEKINAADVVPPPLKYDFKYEKSEHFRIFDSEKDSKKAEPLLENTKPELPEGILSQEMSDNEIIEKLKEHGGELLDKAMEEKNVCIYNFMMRRVGVPLWPGETDEEFIDYVLKTEIKKTGSGSARVRFLSKVRYKICEIEDDTVIQNSFHEQKNRFNDKDFSDKIKKVFLGRDDLIERILQVRLGEIHSNGKCFENISRKIDLLMWIGTKKTFFKVWEILGERKYDRGLYVEIVRKWAEHFPTKLLKKEIENQNEACLWGVVYSHNEYAIRALFARFCKGDNVVVRPSHHMYEGSIYTIYYRMLICLPIIVSQEEKSSIMSNYGYDVERWGDQSSGYEICFVDIIDIINSDTLLGQILKKTFEKFNIDLSRKNINLLYEYIRDPEYTEIKRWLHEHDAGNLNNSKLSTNEYDEMRYTVLEKPFLFPELSWENIDIMANYFNRRLPFSDFEKQFENKSIYKREKRDLMWKHYWQYIIEKAYQSFKQPELEKPLLPIIPEFADYLLSRTDTMFSTAIEKLPYIDYKAFLTESRKLQIKICLKNGTIRQEEFEKLTALAESPDKNYYAWSDEEIKSCLSPDTDSERLDKINAILEPEFMVRIFEKSILWVMKHRDSELWLGDPLFEGSGAPWFGMQIFNKSYKDRPAIWAKHLIKIIDEWTGSENMLRRICMALGHLREPLGGKVPLKLREMLENPKYESIKEDIDIQLSLFKHENFKKMHHDGNEIKRVTLCKKELIMGQNREMWEKTERW